MASVIISLLRQYLSLTAPDSTDVVILNVNVLGPLVVHRVLSHRHSTLIVLHNEAEFIQLNCRIHTASCVARHNAIYLASTVESATEVCFLLDQTMAETSALK